jgi:type IV pilus assembly protein PilQ
LDQPTAQVLIEAHIIEATSQTARELGIQWGGLYRWNRQSDNYWIAPNAGDAIGVDSSTDGVNPSTGWASNFPADLTAATVAGSGFSLGMIAETSNAILSAQLTALEEEGQLNILSKPSITTLDNQAAIIESGDDIPFQTVDDNKVQVEYKKAVLRLEVTPHVIEGDTLRLDIVTNKDEPDFSRTVNGNPTVITKYAKTNVVVFDGQTTVIGGLNKQTDQNLDYGTPWLRNIPGLGYLFKGESKGKQMQELLIFITPHILKRRLPVSMTPDVPTEPAPVP